MKFYIESKIYYHDTDSGGVVYYASYLEHLEEGRTEFCRSKGIDLVKYNNDGILFPIVHLEMDYKQPARYGDVIRIFTRVEKIGNASIEFAQEIRKDDAALVMAKTVWACVNKDLKPRRVPEEMRQRLEAKQ